MPHARDLGRKTSRTWTQTQELKHSSGCEVPQWTRFGPHRLRMTYSVVEGADPSLGARPMCGSLVRARLARESSAGFEESMWR